MKNFNIILMLTALSFAAGAVELQESKLDIKPLYHSCSYYYRINKAAEKLKVEFRKSGTEKWQQTFPPVWGSGLKQLRGSIVGLQQNTKYELRVSDSVSYIEKIFKTLNPNPPVARTIYIEDLNFDGKLKITARGKPNGWIKYKSRSGMVLRNKTQTDAVISVDRAEYVILEGLKVRGGKHGIDLKYSSSVRIINCDIAGFGRVGKRDFSRKGWFYDKNGQVVNNDSGVNIFYSKNVTVERCWIHDPRATANAWRTSHPVGPNAIFIVSKGSTVIRWNDFTGSDMHRWNDAVESRGNSKQNGGFYRDAAIYGNMFAFGQDDGIELDGGQMNVLLYENKFEGFLCGISLAPCLLGPSYTFRNLIVNLADVNNSYWAGIKNSFGGFGTGRLNVFNNTIGLSGVGFSNYRGRGKIPEGEIKAYGRNNIYVSDIRAIGRGTYQYKTDFDKDLIWSVPEIVQKESKSLATTDGQEKNAVFANPQFIALERGLWSLKNGSPAIDMGCIVPNFIDNFKGKAPDIGAFEFGIDTVLPQRPIPVYLDSYQLNFKKGQQQSNVIANIKTQKQFTSKFNICISENVEWLKVSPVFGVFKAGSETIFTVTVDPEKMNKSKVYKTVFLVRLENGFSRPVSVYVDQRAPEIIVKEGNNSYFEAEKFGIPVVKDDTASEGKCVDLNIDKSAKLEIDFEILEDGTYYLLARVKSLPPISKNSSCYLSFDDANNRLLILSSAVNNWAWSFIKFKNNGKLGGFLKKGKHSIKLLANYQVFIDTIVLTKNPDEIF